MQLDKYLVSRCVFLDAKDMLCACVLLYHFRIFERRFGSAKFMSYFIVTYALSNIIELFILNLMHLLQYRVDAMPTGLWGPLFSLYVPYYCDIPRIVIMHIWGFPFTGKSITYVVGLQMLSTSMESMMLAGIGVFSGLAYYHNVILMKSWTHMPTFIAHLSENTLGHMLKSPTPRYLKRPMGATLELQRSQYMEQLENMAWLQSSSSYSSSSSSSPPQQEANNINNLFGLFRRYTSQPRNTAISEQQIQQLVDMGFPRDDAIDALNRTNNDVITATSVLLR
ncbi:hypothetical protein HELRODRAFT_186794 [Helobdella robusta]|uniref:UBA domain-containing protein n=1 Tax=Helobdella robusta TaxID=6412 RepID=T1FP37_HELRO|nr:hypothetical protein HELRODRAFT_186794 [Helobdella robusta]ESO09043.1 hypothetical protein HELRODRAFT_186794 [Helobdella robusta]